VIAFTLPTSAFDVVVHASGLSAPLTAALAAATPIRGMEHRRVTCTREAAEELRGWFVAAGRDSRKFPSESGVAAVCSAAVRAINRSLESPA
jgi:hypothetical protein